MPEYIHDEEDDYQLARERVASRLGIRSDTTGGRAESVNGSAWLDDMACIDNEIDDFFVPAGHAISEATLNVCRGCPVRVDCLRHAYAAGISNGYFGGLSPGQRRTMSLVDALKFIANDPVRYGRR